MIRAADADILDAIPGDGGFERFGGDALQVSFSGVLSPDGGVVSLSEQDIAGRPAHEVCRLGITQAPGGRGVFPSLTRASQTVRLSERGTERLNEKEWFTAREYFRTLVDSYPQSIYRGDAKLGLGDTHLGEGTAEGYVMAINEYREFLSFYPTHKRADYAQYKLGMAHFYQMRDAMRDQTETLEAIKELTVFTDRYKRTCDNPNAVPPVSQCSDLLPEAQKRLRATGISDEEVEMAAFEENARDLARVGGK